jgi:hypothetical protein
MEEEQVDLVQRDAVELGAFADTDRCFGLEQLVDAAAVETKAFRLAGLLRGAAAPNDRRRALPAVVAERALADAERRVRFDDR